MLEIMFCVCVRVITLNVSLYQQNQLKTLSSFIVLLVMHHCKKSTFIGVHSQWKQNIVLL